MRSRAYRRHQRARTRARHLRDYYELSASSWDRRWNSGPRKDIAIRHPRDCGRKCYLCHYSKLLGLPRLGDEGWRGYEDAAWG